MTKVIGEITEQLGSGLFPSYPGRKPAFWKDGRNVTFEQGLIQAALGQFLMFAPAQASQITGVKASSVGGVPTVFFGTPTKLWKWDATNGTEDLSGTTYTGTTCDPWTWAKWGDWMVTSNGVDPVQVYKNTGTFGDLAGTPFTWAKVVIATSTHLFALNTSNGGNYIEWTDLDDIEDWTATAINDAGNLPKRNLAGDFVAAEEMGSSIIAYTFNEMLAIDFIGRPFVYNAIPLLEGFGPVGSHAVASVGKIHYGFGQRGIWVTDGVSSEFIQNPAVMNFIYSDEATRVDMTKLDMVVAYHDQLQTQVIFSYPMESGAGYNDISIGYNYKDQNKPFMIYDYGRTAVDDSGVFIYIIAGDNKGNIFQQSVQNAAPATSGLGIVELDETSYTFETGFGTLGLGEGGMGGYSDGTG